MLVKLTSNFFCFANSLKNGKMQSPISFFLKLLSFIILCNLRKYTPLFFNIWALNILMCHKILKNCNYCVYYCNQLFICFLQFKIFIAKLSKKWGWETLKWVTMWCWSKGGRNSWRNIPKSWFIIFIGNQLRIICFTFPWLRGGSLKKWN